VAAGAGREAVYLALQGFEVEARDRDPEALARAAALAARHGVAISTVVTDLERGAVALPPNRYQLVICFRYLHRPLFHQIESALAPRRAAGLRDLSQRPGEDRPAAARALPAAARRARVGVPRTGGRALRGAGAGRRPGHRPPARAQAGLSTGGTLQVPCGRGGPPAS
jgi:hypothetical protein